MKQETLEEVKDLSYYRNNAEEDYLAVPISVMRYISLLEQEIEKSYNEEEVRKIAWESRKFFHKYKNTPFNKIREVFYEWFKQFKKKSV